RLGRRLRLFAARDGGGRLAAAAARLSRGHAGRAAAVPRCRAADPGCGAGASRAVVTAVGSVARSVFRNPELRRVQVAFVAFNAAEWGVWIAMLVYAYERGGATEAGIVAVVQLVPATVFAPFAAGLGDRFPPARVLTLAYVLQAAAVAAPPFQAFRLVREEPEARLLLGLLAAESVAIGALDVVYVVLAISLLDLGGSDAGYLNAAFGAGGVAGIVATATLVGRK